MPVTPTVLPPTGPAPATQPKPGLLSSVAVGRFSPSLLVVKASVTDRGGITEHLAVTTPAAPYGTAAWQTAALSLYLAAVRAGREELSARALRDFLDPDRRTPDGAPHPARLPFPGAAFGYPHDVLQDRRVTCVLAVSIGAPSPSGWPEAALLVWEREEGGSRARRCGFDRTTRHHGALAVTAAAHQEMEAEFDRLRARARDAEGRWGADGLAQEAALADRVTKLCKEAREQVTADVQQKDGEANAKVQRAGRERARAAVRRLPLGAPEDLEQVAVRPAMEAVTGRVARPVDLREQQGRGLVARIHIEVDSQDAPRGGAALPGVLMCSLEGEAAEAAANRLQPGDRVVARGRRVVRVYRGADGVPRTAVVLEVEGLGVDITR